MLRVCVWGGGRLSLLDTYDEDGYTLTRAAPGFLCAACLDRSSSAECQSGTGKEWTCAARRLKTPRYVAVLT